MTKIKGLDGRPIRTKKTLEEIQRQEIVKLGKLQKQRAFLGETPSDLTQHLDNMIQAIQNILDFKKTLYKEQAYAHISRAVSNLQTQIFLVYEKQKESPGVIGILLALFLEGMLKIIQDVEVMEGTPKDMEICSKISHKILHIPVWEELLKTNNRVHQILLFGSYILARRIEKRRLSGEDNRLVVEFVHNPQDIRPLEIDTNYMYTSYGNDMNPDANTEVTFRQMIAFTKPKIQTPYNLEMFDFMYKELWKVFDDIVEIIKNYR